jgi:hypothetical protein
VAALVSAAQSPGKVFRIGYLSTNAARLYVNWHMATAEVATVAPDGSLPRRDNQL